MTREDELFTYDEQVLIGIYNPGSRDDLIRELEKMRGYLDPDEAELRELTDNVLEKLRDMTDEDFAALDFDAVI